MNIKPNDVDVEIDSPTSDEKLKTIIVTTVDPTGAPPQWQLTSTIEVPDPDGWVDGTWVAGSWDVDGRQAVANTPSLQDLGVSVHAKYVVWVRWTIPGEQPERRAGVIKIGGPAT